MKIRSVVSLFTGAGGLDLGLESAGFKNKLCVEIDGDCRETIKLNKKSWNLAEPGDIHALSTQDMFNQSGIDKENKLDLIAAGPPCQPFSKSGYWSSGDTKRLVDPRANTLKALLNTIELFLPEAILIENVKGLIYRDKDEGLRFLLNGIKKINSKKGTSYDVHVVPINCSHYGVPQVRERVFLLASKKGLDFQLPTPQMFMEGAEKEEEFINRNVWDAIGDLDNEEWPNELAPRGKWADLLPCIPEGENYLWHTPRSKGVPLFGWRTRYWSFMLKLKKDKPSWTIQAKPGPATGPFHWKSRHLSVRELARIQTFPDNYEFYGDYKASHKQIGNAVPPAIAHLLGTEIRRQFFGERPRRALKFLPPKRQYIPAPERVKRVPKKFLQFIGEHEDHPGAGLGPKGRNQNNESVVEQ